jgi:hypothetical protein
MTQNPTLKAVSFNDLADKYHALDFQDALADFITWINYPLTSATTLKALAQDTLLPFQSVPVFHKIKFISICGSDVIDCVHVWHEQRDARRRLVPARFDTVLIHGGPQGGRNQSNPPLYWCNSLLNCCAGLQVAQVQVVFQLPSKIIRQVIPSSEVTPPMHLAYVEWFSPIPTTPESNSRLYKVSRLTQDSRHLASIIPVNSILCSVHLFPRFRQETLGWNTFSVLELCPTFYINPFSSRDVFLLFM